MTTENENNTHTAKKPRQVRACDVFEMLSTHAGQYQTAITISDVQKDIESTFGVRLDRGAISFRLRNLAANGLITRVDSGKNSDWVFSDRLLSVMGRSRQNSETTKPVKTARGLLKAASGTTIKNREFCENVTAFIRASKKKGRDLVFTTDSVLNFLRLHDMPVPPRARIAKAVGNMIFQQRGVVKTDRPAVYCVPADETRFNKSAVRRPDVVTLKNARQTATTPTATEIQQMSQAVVQIAAAFRALSRLSDLIGNFKE